MASTYLFVPLALAGCGRVAATELEPDAAIVEADAGLVDAAALPTTRWAWSFGDTGSDEVRCATLGSDGRATVAANFEGTVALGGDTVTSTTPASFVAAISADGEPLAATPIIPAGDFRIDVACARDALGNSAFTGALSGSARFGTQLVAPRAGIPDTYVARFTSDGALSWARPTGTDQASFTAAVSMSPAGTVDVVHMYAGNASLGGPTFNAPTFDALIGRFSGTGAHVSSMSRGGGGSNDVPFAIATDASDAVVIAGAFNGATNLGGPDLAVIEGSHDTFVVKYNAGTHVFSRVIPSLGEAGFPRLAIGANNEIWVASRFTGTATFGGHALTSAGGADIAIIRFDAAGGILGAWSVGGAGEESELYAIAAFEDELLVYFTVGEDGATVGDTVVGGRGGLDTVLVRFRRDGSVVDARTFGGASNDIARSVAAGPAGVLIGGAFADATLEIGEVTLTGHGSSDGFLALLH